MAGFPPFRGASPYSSTSGLPGTFLWTMGGGQTELSLRSYESGAILVVVARGRIDGTNVHRFAGYLAKMQASHDVALDLVDVPFVDRSALRVIAEAARRAERGGWAFAVVAKPHGPVAEEIRSYRGAQVRTVSSVHAARNVLLAHTSANA